MEYQEPSRAELYDVRIILGSPKLYLRDISIHLSRQCFVTAAMSADSPPQSNDRITRSQGAQTLDLDALPVKVDVPVPLDHLHYVKDEPVMLAQAAEKRSRRKRVNAN